MEHEELYFYWNELVQLEAAVTVPITTGARAMCPCCGVQVAPRNLVDERRHRRWHRAVPERRALYGNFLLGPDQIFLAQQCAAELLGDEAGSIRSRRQGALLFVQGSFSLSVLQRDQESWWRHPSFERYVSWFIKHHAPLLADITGNSTLQPLVIRYLDQVARGELVLPDSLYQTHCAAAE